MYIVEGVKDNERWIAGAFLKKASAVTYVQEIAEKERPYFTIKTLREKKYPLYYIDISTANYQFDYRFVKKNEIIELIEAIELKEGEETHYFNINIIDKDLTLYPPGTGNGAIGHIHINNDTIKWHAKNDILRRL